MTLSARTFLIVVLTILYTGVVRAEPPEETPWYHIEVIVFARNAPGAGSTEIWPDNPGIPDASGTVRLKKSRLRARADANPGELITEPYEILPRGLWQLNQEHKYLDTSRGRYEPLIHLAWRQAVEAREQAQQVHIRSAATLPQALTGGVSSPPPLIEGTLRISIKRYLHADVDLVRNHHRLGEAPVANRTVNVQAPLYGPSFQQYRMQESRRMRADELHYLDHPLMGVLLLASRWEPPAPEPEPQPPVPETTDSPAKNTDSGTPASEARPEKGESE